MFTDLKDAFKNAVGRVSIPYSSRQKLCVGFELINIWRTVKFLAPTAAASVKLSGGENVKMSTSLVDPSGTRDASPLFVQFLSFSYSFWQNLLKQECIPVGCVSPARLRYPVVSVAGVCPPRPLDADLLDADTPSGCRPCPFGCRPYYPTPLVDRITDTCENITLPQTLFAGGNNRFSPQTQGLVSPSRLGNAGSVTEHGDSMISTLCFT